MKANHSNKLIILLLLIFLGCRNTIENQIISPSGWVIYEFNANFSIQTPGISFNVNHTCNLPMVEDNDYLENKTVGTWKHFNRNKKDYIIINSLNKRFNNVEFEIKGIETIIDSNTMGYYKKLTLESDSIKMICYRVLLK